MKTLRLLLWLRWTLFLRTSSAGNRFAAMLLNLLFAFMFSPLWLGGAIAAFTGVRLYGAPAVLAAFALCQFGWLYFGLLAGALGRSFDLDAWLRWPVRPRTVYAFNIVASVIEPVCLMTLPTIGAVVWAVAWRAGAPAAIVAALAGLLLTLLTAALLQLLLALLDESFRLPWIRYVAITLLPLSFLGMQVTFRKLATDALLKVAHQSITPEQALALVNHAFRFVPTAAWPAAIVNGMLEHAPLRAAAGAAGALALLALAIAPGAWLMRRTARAGEGQGGGKAAAAPRAAGRGTYAVRLPGLSRPLGLLLAREIRYTLQTPQRLVSLFLTPLIVVFFYSTSNRNPVVSPIFVLLMMSSQLSTASMLLFSYDGPGIRTLYLLPCRPRDIVLAKNYEFLGRIGLQILFVFAALSFFTHSLWTVNNAALILASFAVVGIVVAIGTWVSIRYPVKARSRGMMMRSSGTGWGGLWVMLGSMACAVLVFGAIWLARRAAGPAWQDAAGLAAGLVGFALGAAIWWRSIDRNAEALLANREGLIEVLAKLDAA